MESIEEKDFSKVIIRRDESSYKRCCKLKEAIVLYVQENRIQQQIMILGVMKLVKSIDIANNGQEAVEKFIARKYDIILMTLNLPVIDGFQATKTIREIEERSEIVRTPILLLPILTYEREHYLTSGFDNVVPSGFFQFEVLIKKMKYSLSGIIGKKIVVFTGAGISQESGIDTYRDSGGVWEKHDFMEVAHINAWYNNPSKVLDFFNIFRKKIREAEPNNAHHILAELGSELNATIITQNVDDLHERAGSHKVIHLHGEITKARSSIDPNLIIELRTREEIRLGKKAPDGSQLRPHLVLFGEPVDIQKAIDTVKTADIFVIIGTSLNVYPASKLISAVKQDTPIYLIDPNDVNSYSDRKIIKIKEKATVGTKILKDILMENHVIE